MQLRLAEYETTPGVAPQPHLSSQDYEMGAAGQGKQLRRFLDQSLERSLVRKAHRVQDPPVPSVVAPYRGHQTGNTFMTSSP